MMLMMMGIDPYIVVYLVATKHNMLVATSTHVLPIKYATNDITAVIFTYSTM